jgi:molybdenum storage protein
MSNLVSGDGRTHIESRLMRESLQDRRVVAGTDSERDVHIFPDAALIGIGGQSIFDRGKDAILPLVDEIAAIKRDLGKKMVLAVGGGTRVRHTLSVGARPGPAGRRHRAADRRDGGAERDPPQHAAGQARLDADAARSLLGSAAVLLVGHPADRDLDPAVPLLGAAARRGRAAAARLGLRPVPARRGAVDGPAHLRQGRGRPLRQGPGATPTRSHIPRITLAELLANPPPTNILDAELFRAWATAKNITRVQIVNGLKPGMLTAALAARTSAP